MNNFVEKRNTKLEPENPIEGHIKFTISSDTKLLQGEGECKLINEISEIEHGLQLRNRHFSRFSEQATTEWILDEENEYCVYKIEPTNLEWFST